MGMFSAVVGFGLQLIPQRPGRAGKALASIDQEARFADGDLSRIIVDNGGKKAE